MVEAEPEESGPVFASAEKLAQRKLVKGVRTGVSEKSKGASSPPPKSNLTWNLVDSSSSSTSSSSSSSTSAPSNWDDFDAGSTSWENNTFPDFTEESSSWLDDEAKQEKIAAGEQDKITTILKIAATLSDGARKELVLKIGAIDMESSSSKSAFGEEEISWESASADWASGFTSEPTEWKDNFADESFQASTAVEGEEEDKDGNEDSLTSSSSSASVEVPAGEEGETRLFSSQVNLSHYTDDPDYQPPAEPEESDPSSSSSSSSSAAAPVPKRWVDRGSVQLRVLEKDLGEGKLGHRIVARSQATNNLYMNVRLSPVVRISTVENSKIRIICKDESNQTTQYLIKIKVSAQGELYDLLTKYSKAN